MSFLLPKFFPFQASLILIVDFFLQPVHRPFFILLHLRLHSAGCFHPTTTYFLGAVSRTYRQFWFWFGFVNGLLRQAADVVKKAQFVEDALFDEHNPWNDLDAFILDEVLSLSWRIT